MTGRLASYHGEDGHAGDAVAEQDAQRAALRQGATNPKEQACSYGSAQCDELDVS